MMKSDSDAPKPPLAIRLIKSIVRIFIGVIALLGAIYAWNPQKIHYPRVIAPNPNPRIDPDSKRLFSPGTRVCVVAGHPDDAEFYISGTLLRLHDAGAKITLVVVTDGDKGYYPPFTTNVEENRKVRRVEQVTASEAYGAEVVFLGGPDGRYNPDDTDGLLKLSSALKEIDPDYICCFEPKYLPLVQHRDHENSGKAAKAVANQTRAKWLLYYSTTANNFYVDTSKYWEKRAELLAVHKSQFYGEKLQRIKLMVMSRSIEQGEINGTEFAEGFRAERLNP